MLCAKACVRLWPSCGEGHDREFVAGRRRPRRGDGQHHVSPGWYVCSRPGREPLRPFRPSGVAGEPIPRSRRIQRLRRLPEGQEPGLISLRLHRGSPHLPLRPDARTRGPDGLLARVRLGPREHRAARPANLPAVALRRRARVQPAGSPAVRGGVTEGRSRRRARVRSPRPGARAVPVPFRVASARPPRRRRRVRGADVQARRRRDQHERVIPSGRAGTGTQGPRRRVRRPQRARYPPLSPRPPGSHVASGRPAPDHVSGRHGPPGRGRSRPPGTGRAPSAARRLARRLRRLRRRPRRDAATRRLAGSVGSGDIHRTRCPTLTSPRSCRRRAWGSAPTHRRR